MINDADDVFSTPTPAAREAGVEPSLSLTSHDQDTVMEEEQNDHAVIKEEHNDPAVPIRAVYDPESPVPAMPPTPFLAHRELPRHLHAAGAGMASLVYMRRRSSTLPAGSTRPVIPSSSANHHSAHTPTVAAPVDPSHPDSLAAIFSRASIGPPLPPRTPSPQPRRLPSRETTCPAAPRRGTGCIQKSHQLQSQNPQKRRRPPAWARHVQDAANAFGFPMTVTTTLPPSALVAPAGPTELTSAAAAPSAVRDCLIPTYLESFAAKIWFDQRQRYTFRHIIVGNLPQEFDLAQLLKHVPRALAKQILRLTLADTTVTTGALSAVIETANDCAATLIASFLATGKNHSRDVSPQPRPITFRSEGVPVANIAITVSRHLAASHAVTQSDKYLGNTDCQRTIEINSVDAVEAAWIAKEALQRFSGIVAGLYDSEKRMLTLEFCNLAEASHVEKAITRHALENAPYTHQQKYYQQREAIPQKVRFVDPLVFFHAESPTPQVSSAFAPCELNPIRRLASSSSSHDPSTTTISSPADPFSSTAPFCPNMHHPRNRLPSSYFSAQALDEHTLTLRPAPRVDVDSELAPGVKARVRSTRVGWGVVYTMTEFDKLIELRYMNSDDPFWAALIDELYQRRGGAGCGINLRRMFGRPPVAANLWGLLRR